MGMLPVFEAWKSMRSVPIILLAAMLGAAPAVAGQPADPAVISVLADFVRPKTVPYPADNPYSTAKAALGEKLFFDTRMSGDGKRSCASCHAPASGWQDALPRNQGLSTVCRWDGVR